jgi:chromosome partitioning protein
MAIWRKARMQGENRRQPGANEVHEAPTEEHEHVRPDVRDDTPPVEDAPVTSPSSPSAPQPPPPSTAESSAPAPSTTAWSAAASSSEAPGARPPGPSARVEPSGLHFEDDEVTSGDDEVGDLPAAPSPPRERAVRQLPRVIAVANQKGGVGKTTTTVNLGASLALFGYRTLVVDLDPQGNATTGLGVDARGFQHSMYDVLLSDTPMVDCIEPVGVENLFVAPATLDLAGVEQELFSALSRELRLKRALATVVDDYDFIFIDCPPSLGLITINAFAAASEILVPVQCEFYALEGLTQLQRIVSLVQRNLNEDLEISTVVLTMYDARTRLSEDVANEVRRHFPSQTQGTVIPRTVRLSEAPSFGQPITTFDPASKGARAYKALAREVSDGAEKRAG